MKAIIEAAIERANVVIFALVVILGAGAFAYFSIAKESDPDVNIPIIYVSMTLEGISPEDGERLLVRPMEQKLRSIEGVKEMRSTAREGFASVLLEFDAGFDAKKAMQRVREKVDIAKAEIPAETDEPKVSEVNVGLFPVLVVMLSGQVPDRALYKKARDLKDRLEGIAGVLSADIVGDRKEVLEVVVNPVRLESYRISTTELLQTINLNNRLVAAGALDTGAGRFAVKVPGLFKTPADVLDLPAKVSGDGVVRIRDVTDVRLTFKDAQSYARLDGQPTVALEIRKRLGFNVIDAIEQVRKVVAEEQKIWPANLEVTFIQDKSVKIRDMLTDLTNSIIAAVVLVMIVVLAALGLRSAGIVGIAIPGSFLIGILYLYAFGFTINIVVLFSLILAVGMLVDGAVIVTEFADRRMAEGKPRAQAYSEAAQRMAWPVFASTATTIAAFLPLLFWPGVVGQFMKFLPITLVITLVGSLLMAFVFIPALGSKFGRLGVSGSRDIERLAALEGGNVLKLQGFTGAYARFLHSLVRKPWRTVAVLFVTIGLMIGVQGLYSKYGHGVEFFPDVDPDNAIVLVHARGNFSTDEKDRLVREVEARVRPLNDFAAVYTRVGAAGSNNQQSEDTIGTLLLELKDWRVRRRANAILADIRERTKDIPGIFVEARKPESGPPTGKAIRLQVASRFPERIDPTIEAIRAMIDKVADLRDIEDSRPIPGIEWQLAVDRSQAGRFGADVATIGSVVQMVTNGAKVGAYRPNDVDEEVEIRVRFPLDERGINQLDTLRVPTRDGIIPISNFVQRTAAPKVGTLQRVAGKRIVSVEANVVEGVNVDGKVKEIAALLKNIQLPPDVEVKFKGQDEEQQRAQKFLSQAFIAAIVLIALILVIEFNSFYYALLVLSAIIFSTIGVMVGLLVTGQTFGIVMTGVGIITLAGVIVNNNIVLIDTYAILRRSGLDPIEAAVRTGAQRLRPVFLTAFTAIVGLLPMALSLNVDFVNRLLEFGAPSTQWWVQLSTAVSSGLMFGTVLTLVVTPCLLALGEHTRAGVRRLFRRRQAAPLPGALPAE
ncbi:MAG: efflux RND transporter permease subunit [Alphaproteobacteria bacterium]|nr:efflux RND transporter permease subunit [Alphaproteobacteria bacterium]